MGFIVGFLAFDFCRQQKSAHVWLNAHVWLKYGPLWLANTLYYMYALYLDTQSYNIVRRFSVVKAKLVYLLLYLNYHLHCFACEIHSFAFPMWHLSQSSLFSIFLSNNYRVNTLADYLACKPRLFCAPSTSYHCVNTVLLSKLLFFYWYITCRKHTFWSIIDLIWIFNKLKYAFEVRQYIIRWYIPVYMCRCTVY